MDAGAILQLENQLDGVLAICRASHQLCPFLRLQSTGYDLGCTGRPAINQHHQWKIDKRTGFFHLEACNSLAAILLLDDHPLVQKQTSRIYTSFYQAAGVITQIEDKMAGALIC